MKGKQKHYTKEELTRLGRAQKEALDTAGKVMLLITLIILHDRYHFGPVRLNRYMEQYEDVLKYYNESDDYQGLLKEWANYFKDYAGIEILPERGQKQ